MYAVAHIPSFFLQAARRREWQATGRPAVLVEEGKRRLLILEADPAAREKEILPGMPLVHALARAPRLLVFRRSEEAEQSATRALLDAAGSITPRIEDSGPGLCTLDLSGQGEKDPRAPTGRLLERLRPLGLHASCGVAETADLALLAARAGTSGICTVSDRTSFLDSLGIGEAGLPPRLLEILRLWGVSTLGQLARFRRQDLSQRLGVEAAGLWDQINARTHRPLHLYHPPLIFRETVDLEHPVETLEPLLFLLRRFLDQLVLGLETAGRAARAMTLSLRMTDGSKQDRTFDLPQPSRNPGRLFQVLYLHLEQVRTAAALGGVSLELLPTDHFARQEELFNAALNDPWQFADTQARLVGLVGPGRVGSPRLLDTHRPDSIRMDNLPETLEPAVEPEGPSLLGPPLRRWRPPVPATVDLQEGLPAEVHTGTGPPGRRVWAARGPWRLSGSWWERGIHWDRMEWDVELEDGRVYRLVQEDGGWKVEGAYD